jgi:hypothetical protein
MSRLPGSPLARGREAITCAFAILALLAARLPAEAQGPVAYWPLDGDAADRSGHGNNGTVFGAETVAGKMAQALKFDGIDDEITVSAGAELSSVTAGAHSYSAWVFLTREMMPYPYGAFVIDSSDPTVPYPSNDGDQRGLRFLETSAPCFKWVTTTRSYQLCASTAVSLFEWHHIAGVYDGLEGRIYVDGVLSGRESSSGTATRTQVWKIGNVSAGGTGLGFFPGLIDDVRVYNRALTAAEVATLSSGLVAHWRLDGDCVDATGNGNDCVVVGAQVASGAIGSAYEFDGVDDELVVSVGPELRSVTAGPHSISAWVKLEETPTVPKFVVDSVNPALGGDFGDQRGLRFHSDATPVFKWVTDAGPGCQFAGNGLAYCLASDGPIGVGQWHHIAGVYDANAGRIYVDGVMRGSIASAGIPTPTTIWKIGNVSGGGTGTGFFQGAIDDVRVYNRALTGAEIAALSHAEVTAPPIAEAGSAQTVDATGRDGALVVLDGRASYDLAGRQLAFAWTDETGRTLGNTAVVQVQVAVGTHTYTLTVDNGNGGSASDSVTVTVREGAVVLLIDSHGNPVSGATVQYYVGSWQDFGTTGSDGKARKAVPFGSYTFRMMYAGGVQDKGQNLNTSTLVVFQTVNVTVQLKNSLGASLDTGSVQYYAGSWRAFGTTSAGQASLELLPVNYTFRMTYAGGVQDKTQNVGLGAGVVFQTVNVMVQLRNSLGTPLDTGTVQYYAGSWRPFGTTAAGQVSLEMLPVSYTFRMTYAGGVQDRTQNMGTSATVGFVTALVHSVSGTCIRYYAGAWRTFIQDSELLPASYPFRFNDGTPDTTSLVVGGVNQIH